MRIVGHLLAAAALTIPACGASNNEPRGIDPRAWQNVPANVLQTHPVFSTMPRRTEQLSDGNELWTYSACERWVEDQQCVGFGGPGLMPVACEGGRIGEHCCHNQFLITKPINTVGWYRVVGECETQCDARTSKECAPR